METELKLKLNPKFKLNILKSVYGKMYNNKKYKRYTREGKSKDIAELNIVLNQAEINKICIPSDVIMFDVIKIVERRKTVGSYKGK